MQLLGYLREIESDLSVFHRIEEVREMPSRRFFALVPFLSSYQGAVAARLGREGAQREQPASPGVQPSSSPAVAPVASLAEIASIAGPSLSIGTSGG